MACHTRAFRYPHSWADAKLHRLRGLRFNSALLNENKLEQNYYGVAALQRSINGADVQLSYFTRYSSVHFVPDTLGDLVFNGVASNVFRSDYANGGKVVAGGVRPGYEDGSAS